MADLHHRAACGAEWVHRGVDRWITAEVIVSRMLVWRAALLMRVAGTAGSVATSLLFFILVYGIVFSAGALYILRLIAKGPESDEPAPESKQPPGTPLGAAIGEAP
jgi:cytochrome d ubiquinol oxidase subunit I